MILFDSEIPMSNRPVIHFNASAVAALIGKHPFVSPIDALRQEIETWRNGEYRERLMEVAEMRIPNLRVIEKRAEKAISNSDTFKAFATAVEFSPVLDAECRREVAATGGQAFQREAPLYDQESGEELSVSGEEALNTQSIVDSFVEKTKTRHFAQRGVAQEPETIRLMKESGRAIEGIPSNEKARTINIYFKDNGEDYIQLRDPMHWINRSDRYYVLVGRIDAWKFDADGRIIIEIKHRQSRFMSLSHEIDQLMCYQVLYQCDRGMIIQCLDGKIKQSDIYYLHSHRPSWVSIKAALDKVAGNLLSALNSKERAQMLLRSLYPISRTKSSPVEKAPLPVEKAPLPVEKTPLPVEKASPPPVEKAILFNGEDSIDRDTAPKSILEPTLMVKRLTPCAILPMRGSAGAAGYDLYSAVSLQCPPRSRKIVKTGIAIAIPSGTYGRIAPRSGLSIAHSIDIGGGVIDSDYRGEVGVILINNGDTTFAVNEGDRIAQLIIERNTTPSVVEVGALPVTVRGSGGFGSTGK